MTWISAEELRAIAAEDPHLLRLLLDTLILPLLLPIVLSLLLLSNRISSSLRAAQAVKWLSVILLINLSLIIARDLEGHHRDHLYILLLVAIMTLPLPFLPPRPLLILPVEWTL